MKNFKHLFAIVAIGAVFSLFLTACPTESTDDPSDSSNSFSLTIKGVRRQDSNKVPQTGTLTFTKTRVRNNRGTEDINKDLSDVFANSQVSVSADNTLTLTLGTPKFGPRDWLRDNMEWVRDSGASDEDKEKICGIQAIRIQRFLDKDENIRLQMNWGGPEGSNEDFEVYLYYVNEAIKVKLDEFLRKENWDNETRPMDVTFLTDLDLKKGWNMVLRQRNPKDDGQITAIKYTYTSLTTSADIQRVEVRNN